jgi:hypothetical protein
MNGDRGVTRARVAPKAAEIVAVRIKAVLQRNQRKKGRFGCLS